jgi:hypothetical protein
VITSRPKDILYKHAHFLKPTGKTLQEHLLKARENLRLAKSREQKFGDDADLVRVWNRNGDFSRAVCFTLLNTAVAS